MGAGHAHPLYVHEHSRLHRLASETKVAAAFLFVVAVAVTPPRAAWAFVVYGAVVVGLVTASRVGPRFVLLRLVAVLPFVLFAVFIPFIATGEQVEVLGVSVSREGLWGAWNILAKATIGASVSILLAATTEIPDILRGMSRLRVPTLLVSIASFMIRYLQLIVDELGRMRTAMVARGYDPRWLWQARPVAASAGALFVRSYERGERVHTAMLARGFTGEMPDLGHRPASRAEWAAAMTVPVVAAVVAAAAILTT